VRRGARTCMRLIEAFRPFVRRLEASGLTYCITGSVASGVYGEVRTTRDIDFVLLLRIEDIKALRAAFPEDDFYLPPVEVLIAEARRSHRGMFNIINNAEITKADIFIAARDPLHHWALQHRVREDLDGEPAWLAPVEYVIVRKLEAYREGGQEKHPRDITFMLASREVNRDFIESQVERLGLREQWLVCQPEAH